MKNKKLKVVSIIFVALGSTSFISTGSVVTKANDNEAIVLQKQIEKSVVNLEGANRIDVNGKIDLNLNITFPVGEIEYYAAEFILEYDSTNFEFIDIQGLDDNVLINHKILENGNIKIILGTKGKPITSKENLLNIKLKGIKAGENRIISLSSNKIATGQGEIDSIENIEKVISVDEATEIKVGKIKNLKAENVTSDSVNLKWETPKYATGLEEYVIYKDGKVFETISANETSVVIDNLKTNTLYNFKVTAKYSNGEVSRPTSVNARTKKAGVFNFFKSLFN